ncbi:hypothetical protein [Calothrix sp. 336/3]|uniref:hypothetical protein n=1 Tax=Calothrix sp. 336/3 TaxID=1337936 RepID=UPI0004E323C8|nr:hypothetical protein [Calothrix sp. 336/3]AKG22368.1 hypothetical protein IJ00_14820 [Calothrix sp. 336/3]
MNTSQFSWYQVPDNIKELLILAAETSDNPEKAENYLNQALSQSPESLDILISAYRFFYYKYNYQAALKIALKVVEKIQVSENLPQEWEKLKLVITHNKENPQIRLYINAYAASGLILAKLGKVEEAKEICQQIQEIDSQKEFGTASILLDILTRPPEEE